MRSVLAVLALLIVAGCGASSLSLGAPVKILTSSQSGGSQPMGGKNGPCYTNWADGTLLADAEFGTAFTWTRSPGSHAIVVWPVGFTARQAGSEVAVVAPTGEVVATTGRSYRLPGGAITGGSGLPDGPVWFACWAHPT